MERTQHASTLGGGQTDLFDRPPGPRDGAARRDRAPGRDAGDRQAGPRAADAVADGTPADRQGEEVRLRRALDHLAFAPLPDGVRTTSDAFYVFGWHDGIEPDGERVAKRFRDLTMIFHPDSGVLPSAAHMAQLIDARDSLVRQFGRSRRSRLADILAR